MYMMNRLKEQAGDVDVSLVLLVFTFIGVVLLLFGVDMGSK